MKTVKKWCVAAILLCFLTVGFGASAATATVDAVGASFEPVQGWYCFSRFETPDSAVVTELGYASGDQLIEYMKKSSIAYVMLSPDMKTEISVFAKSHSQTKDIYDYNLLPEEELENIRKSFLEQNDDAGEVVYCERRSHTQAVFFEAEMVSTQLEEPVRALEYMTVVNGYALSFTMYAYDGEIDEAERAAMADLFAGLTFAEITEKPFWYDLIYGSFGRIFVFIVIGAIVGAVWAIVSLKKKKAAASVMPDWGASAQAMDADDNEI